MNPFLEVLYNSEPDTSIRVGADWWDFRESDAADSDAATSVTPELDIVFVHGMNPANVPKHAYRTWTHEDGTMWPRDLLPKLMPASRIMLFGYNSNIALGSSNATIFDHASALLSLLSEKRSTVKSKTRNLLFVAHSLGGLVVKQALIVASLDSGDAHVIQESTLGIIFFATPHRGGNGVQLAEVVSNAVLRISGSSSAKNDILMTLKPLSRNAQSLTQHFRPLLEKFLYISFFETRPKKVKKSMLSWVSLLVVDRHSAVLGLASLREEQVACDADHSEICKLSAVGFKAISERLVGFVARAKKEKDALAKPKTELELPLPFHVSNSSGFDGWLSQFQGPAIPTCSESARGKTTMRDVTVATSSQNIDDDVSLPVFQDDIPVELLISGLKKDNSPTTYRVKASVGSCSRIDELIISLKQKGFIPLYGFHNPQDDIGIGPTLHLQTPIPVTVTSSPSRYDWSTGPLLINQHETFDAFAHNVALHRPVHIYLPPSGDSPAPSLSGTKIQIRCGSVRLAISFMRTLRVPDTDNSAEQSAPSAVGKFPLFNAAQFSGTLPGKMAEKGGILMPMYQREAMFMLFECESEHGTPHDPAVRGAYPWNTRTGKIPEALAIRVFIGGVNVLTGRPAASREAKAQEDVEKEETEQEQEQEQDYVVVPGQRTLYGATSGKGTVRQFVAMQPGFGYTVEEQLTGTGAVGGIQLEIWREKGLPYIRTMDPPYKWRSPGKTEEISPTLETRKVLEEAGADTPEKFGLWVDDVFDLQCGPMDSIREYMLPYTSRLVVDDDCYYPDPGKQRAAMVHDLFKGKRNRATLEIRAVTDPLVATVDRKSGGRGYKFRAKRRSQHRNEAPGLLYWEQRKADPENCRTYKCCPFLMGWELHNLVRKDPFFKLASHQPHHVYLGFGEKRIWNERIWNDRHRTLFDYGVRGADPVEMYCFYKPPTGPEAIIDREDNKRTPTWEMGIAAGGKLRQEIFPDPIRPAFARWDVNAARFLNVQILNSVAFNMVTGVPTPQTPVTPQVYTGYGFQFMKEYEERTHDLNGPVQDGETSNTADVDTGETHPIHDIASVSKTDALLQAAKRIVTRTHIDPAAPATACMACEVRAREFRGRGFCDQILRPCNHAVCAECRGELVVEMMSLALAPDVAGGAIFLCPLCGEPVVETVTVGGPMKVPSDEGRGFVMFGIGVGRG